MGVAEFIIGPAEGRARWHPAIWHPMMGFAKSSTHPTRLLVKFSDAGAIAN